MVFGDVALSENQVRDIHGESQSPGAGGWPTIRYFNKDTGYGGKAYPKKTSDAMCDELGPKQTYMQQFVEEQGGVSLCDINASDKGCSDKQKEFIVKWADKPLAEVKKQLDRLLGMTDKNGASMKPEALTWAKQRVGIYKQIVKKGGGAAKEGEL